jgi:hypothetical protein
VNRLCLFLVKTSLTMAKNIVNVSIVIKYGRDVQSSSGAW